MIRMRRGDPLVNKFSRCCPHVATRVTTTLLAEASFRLDHFTVEDICSREHESAVPKVFRQAKTEAASSPASAGAKFMAEAAHRLKTILERIHEDTEQALSLLRDGAGDKRALAWKCKGCGYIKHFTKPVSLEAVARCPRCKSDQFVPANHLVDQSA
jgi:predicted Zn-ribbon and HTH transcriptional regulator